MQTAAVDFAKKNMERGTGGQSIASGVAHYACFESVQEITIARFSVRIRTRPIRYALKGMLRCRTIAGCF
jgi:hypothetical protein